MPPAEDTSTPARLGATPSPDGRTAFAVWAPRADRLAVRLPGGDVPLKRGAGDIWRGAAPAPPGTRYEFVIDGDRALPDPCSRAQPDGLRGPSEVVDLGVLRPVNGPTGVTLADLVIYELHVGTFTEAGTFEAAIGRLADLRDLGVTAIEVMPIATFAGDHGWG